MKSVAILLAGGSGRRFGEDKMFFELAGQSVLARSVAIVGRHPAVDRLVVVTSAPSLSRTERLVREMALSIPWTVVEGGDTRQASSLSGLSEAWRHMRDEGDRVVALIHDAARCLLPPSLVDGLLACIARERCGAAPAIPVTDTIRRLDTSKTHLNTTLPRDLLVAMQTPQGADLAVLLRAAEQAVSDGADVTDDVELLLRIGYPVRFILGSERNMKITTRADAERAAWFIDAIDS